MALFKRGKVWWMSFTYNGRRYRRSCETTDRRLAEKIYHKVMIEVIEGRYFERLPGETRTFREMIEKYREEYLSGLPAGRTCASYINGLIAFFGNYTLKEITPRLIYEFKKMRRSQGVKPATINRQLTLAKRAFNLSVSPQWLKDFLIFAIWTGLRLGNIIGLKRRDVNLKNRTVYIERTKNGEPLIIPLHDRAFEVLKRRLKVKYLEHDYVFTSPEGKPIEPNNLRRSFRIALKRAGIENLRIHDPRHTFGTRLAQAGVDLYTIARLLGHKDIRTTQRYAHHSTQSLRRGIEVLSREVLTQF